LLEKGMAAATVAAMKKKPVSPLGQMGFSVFGAFGGAHACFLLKSLKD
jgi:hypothetical protein